MLHFVRPGRCGANRNFSDSSSRAHVANGSPKQLSVLTGSHSHTYTTLHFLRGVLYIYNSFSVEIVLWCGCSSVDMFPRCTVGVCPFSGNRSSIVQRLRRTKPRSYKWKNSVWQHNSRLFWSLEVCVRILELDLGLTPCSLVDTLTFWRLMSTIVVVPHR